MMMKRLLCALSLCASAAMAQEQYQPIGKLPLGDTLLTLPSPNIPTQGTWEVKFTHRFNQSLSEGSFADQLHSLFGLDSNADVNFGFARTLSRNLELQLSRSNTNDTLEGAAKYVVLQQAPAVPLNVTARAGFDWRTERDLGDRTSFFAQAIVSRQFGRKAEIYLLPTFVTNAGRAVAGDESVALFDHAFNVPIAFTYVLRGGLSIVAEVVPPMQDLPDELDSDPAWAIGIKRAIGAHWFEILVTNSQATTVDQYVTTTFQGSALDAGDVRLGFNIERRFGRRRR